MFSGSYIHSIDQKCRAAMPSKFRDMLKNRFVLTKGPDGCLWALSSEQWQLLLDKASQSITAQRFFLASAVENTLTGKGRFLIPNVLREHADIKPGDDVIIIGLGNRIEIWSRRRWDTVSSQVTSDRIRCELPEIFLL
ncbi:MAG: division/cell wall cluster transcriptional repressor MraZ [Armatimonadota bacterium]